MIEISFLNDIVSPLALQNDTGTDMMTFHIPTTAPNENRIEISRDMPKRKAADAKS